MFTYDLTDEDYALPYNAPGTSKSYFELDDEFRNFVPKRRSDAIKLETILGNSGDVDLETVGGPTGFSGEALDKGIRAYQRRNGLVVDGWVRPGGPTITKMKEQFGGLLGDYEAPSPKQSDTHHRMRDAGHQGFLKAKRQDLMLPPIPGLPKPDENILGGNHSLVRTVRDTGMQQAPDYMANLVRRQGQKGVVEARDFVDQLDKLMPGEGTKAIRGILGALADMPGLQRAFFGGPVIEIAPIGVFEQDGPRRYEQAIQERPWEAHEQGRKIPGDGEVRDAAYRPDRDGPPQMMPLPDKARTPEEEAHRMQPLTDGAEAEASPTPNDLLDPRNWPEAYRTQALSSQDEPLQAEATATDKEDQDAHAIQTAQAQGQPRRPQQQGQQRQQQPQNPPRQEQPQRPNQQARPNVPAQPQRTPNPPRQAQPTPPQPQARQTQTPERAPPVPRRQVESWGNLRREFHEKIAVAEAGNAVPKDDAERSSIQGGRRREVLGRYQLEAATLEGLGLRNADGSWVPGRIRISVNSEEVDVRNDREFLSNREAQEQAMRLAMEAYRQEATNRGFTSRIDTTIKGKVETFQVTEAGLAAAMHRVGGVALRDYFRRMEANGWDSERASRSLQGKDRDLHDAAETRLREFRNERLR